jgi:cephalosporin hydroxylase
MNCQFEDKVTKKSNLEFNDSISTFDGWAAQQNPNVFEVFHNFICKVKPSRILEIGTSLGGFTCFLDYTHKKIGLDCKLISYDIISHPWYQEMRDSGVDIRTENIFDNEYTTLKNEVASFIKEDGVTIILCDGGNKIKEFNLLSNFMKEGDFILAHDYCENREVFEEKIYKKVWNWHEISDSDLVESCEKNNLVEYDKEIFDNVVWVCKIKK